LLSVMLWARDEPDDFGAHEKSFPGRDRNQWCR
jgi:hypothetical protein